MRALTPTVAGILLAFAACSSKGPDYTATGGGDGTHVGSATGSMTTNSLDGGYLIDGGVDGLPTTECPGDTDGMSATTAFVVSELDLQPTEFIEFYNAGSSSVDPSTYSFEGSLAGLQLPSSTIPIGTYAVYAVTLPSASGEIGIEQGGTLLFYMCWGQFAGSALNLQAQSALLWTGGCPPTPTTGLSLHLRATGINAADWQALPPTPLGCAE